jgi:hypothetical protein
MIRWLYLCLAIVDGKPHSRNGQRIELPWSTWDAFDYVDRLGEEGWELVGVTQIQNTNTTWLYFKLPRE